MKIEDIEILKATSQIKSYAEQYQEASRAIKDLDDLVFNKYCRKEGLSRCDPFYCSFKMLDTCDYVKAIKSIYDQHGINIVTGEIKKDSIKKISIVINGVGGIGKDTLCKHANSVFPSKTVSSIDPIKDIAVAGGWNGDKNSEDRKLLVDLKKAFVAYNDLPFVYLMNEYHSFLYDNNEILFVHIREASEIEKFKTAVDIPCITLLVLRPDATTWQNDSDDNVEDYSYDYTFTISEEKTKTRDEFILFLNKAVASIWSEI